MPVVEIKLPKNIADDETLERIRVTTKNHVLGSLSADMAHQDYVVVSEVIGKIGCGVPLVEVDQRPGREKWRKEKFSKLVQKTLQDELGIDPQFTFVVFRESHTEHNFYCGDQFLMPFDTSAHPGKEAEAAKVKAAE